MSTIGFPGPDQPRGSSDSAKSTESDESKESKRRMSSGTVIAIIVALTLVLCCGVSGAFALIANSLDMSGSGAPGPASSTAPLDPVSTKP